MELFATRSAKDRKTFSIRVLDSHDSFPLFYFLFCCCLSVSVICNCCLEEARLPFRSIFAFNGVTLQHHLKWNCMNANNSRNVLMRKCETSYGRTYWLSLVSLFMRNKNNKNICCFQFLLFAVSLLIQINKTNILFYCNVHAAFSRWNSEKKQSKIIAEQIMSRSLFFRFSSPVKRENSFFGSFFPRFLLNVSRCLIYWNGFPSLYVDPC